MEFSIQRNMASDPIILVTLSQMFSIPSMLLNPRETYQSLSYLTIEGFTLMATPSFVQFPSSFFFKLSWLLQTLSVSLDSSFSNYLIISHSAFLGDSSSALFYFILFFLHILSLSHLILRFQSLRVTWSPRL